MAQENFADNQAEWPASEAEEVFEKDIMAVVQASLPDAVSWEELLEQTGRDPQLIELKSAIARGYLTTQERKTLGPQFDPVFTELAVVGDWW